MRSFATLTFLLIAYAAVAQTASDRDVFAQKASRRFPQQVSVGDMLGRYAVGPLESQPALGRVVAVARAEDGGLDIVLRHGAWLGFGGRLIRVPTEATALLGEHVAVMEIDAAALAKAPTAARDANSELSADTKIRMAIVKPFH